MNQSSLRSAKEKLAQAIGVSTVMVAVSPIIATQFTGEQWWHWIVGTVGAAALNLDGAYCAYLVRVGR